MATDYDEARPDVAEASEKTLQDIYRRWMRPRRRACQRSLKRTISLMGWNFPAPSLMRNFPLT